MALSVEGLSFVVDGKWSPDRPEDYAQACALGRRYADELAAHMRETGNAGKLSSVMSRMWECPTPFGTVEIGFCTAIGELVVRS